MLRALATLIMAVGVSLVAVPASADNHCWAPDPDDPNKLVYICNGDGQPPGAGTGPGNGGGHGGPPPCDLSTSPYNEFCEGTAACWGNNPAANPPSENLAGPKPGPAYHMAYKSCRRADGTTYDEWYWTRDADEPTPGERAEAALGALVIPEFAPTFNPPVRTLVNLDTWWWAEGAADPIRGTAALGAVAIAFYPQLEVDPGDGSGVFTCAFTATKSDTCVHVYRKASQGYNARMRIVYQIRFERFGGAPLPTPPGLPAKFTSQWRDVTVPVREVQTVVKPDR